MPNTNARLEIRRYKRGEEAGVWGVYFAATRESIARDYHPDLIERWAPEHHDMSKWVERLEQKQPFVAVINQEIVGMAEIEPDGFIVRLRRGFRDCTNAGSGRDFGKPANSHS